jgi:signal transduction histidine kinase
VSVCCAIDAGVLRIVVADDGIGMGVADGDGAFAALVRKLDGGEGGRGIGNIQRRLTEVGGQAILEPANPGLRVQLTVAVTPQPPQG